MLEDLVRVSDALVSNLRGDQPEKLRLRFADLEHVNPRIVCCSLSGFGMTGPRAREGAYDYTIQGLAGWQSVTGGPDEPADEERPLARGLLRRLRRRARDRSRGVWRARRDGRGADVDLSLFEVALAQLNYIGTWVASRGYEPRAARELGAPVDGAVPDVRRPRTAGSWSRARSRGSGSSSATRSVRPS